MSRVLRYIDSNVWAITPAWLGVIRGIASRSEKVTDLNLQAIEKETGRPIRDTQGVAVRDGVAVVPVHGPLFRYASLFTRFSGAVSVESLARDLGVVAADPMVKEIVVDIDSPGGEINGVEETARIIRGISKQKPVTALVSFLGTSGAYWLASAANRVVTVRTGVLGSIGTVLSVDEETAEEGEIVFRSSQSPLKVVDPTTEAGAAEIQSLLDTLAQVFIESVAEYRGISVEKVLSDFGRGGVLVGDAAVEAGLADATGTLEDIVSELSSRGQRPGQLRPAASADGRHPIRENTMADNAAAEGQRPEITADYLKANHPQVVQQLAEEARAAEQRTQMERVEGVLSVGYDAEGLPRPSARGHLTLVRAAAVNPKTTKAELALQLIDARDAKEAAAKSAKLGALATDEEELDAPAPGAHAGAADPEKKGSSFIIESARKAGVLASKPSKN